VFQFAHLQKARRLVAGRPTDDFAARFAIAMRLAARQMRALFTEDTFIRAISSRNWMPLVTDARWRTIEAQLTEAMEAAINSKIDEAGNAELRRIDTSPVVAKAMRGRFNLRNPFSEDFVRRRGAELVQGITGRARDQIREAVEAGFVQGIPVRTTARTIMDSLGLDSRLARAVQSHGNALSEAGTPDEIAGRSIEAYADKLLRYRAELIARTETIAASNQGVMDSWRQAERENLLPGGMKKRWIHAAGSARTCPICEELGESEPIPINDEFYSSILGVSFARPGAHPACRCSLGLVRP
jgi:hypothetical protein